MYKGLWGIVVLIGCLHGFEASAAQNPELTHELRGVIDEISAETITIRRGMDFFRFERGDLDPSAVKKFKVGDSVEILYSLDAKKIKPWKKDKQQPGEVDRDQKEIIIDDRAFYPAKNGLKKDSEEKAGGSG